jgi:transposase InsO family protein
VIKEIHKESKSEYGSPKIHRELRRRGTRCGRKRVARLMRKDGLKAKTIRKFKATTNSNHNLPVAENLLNRDFTPAEPNKAWVADITYSAPRPGIGRGRILGMHRERRCWKCLALRCGRA